MTSGFQKKSPAQCIAPRTFFVAPSGGSRICHFKRKTIHYSPRRVHAQPFHLALGRKRGLLGSRYYVDYPTISIDKIVAQVNMDMVGRNRDNKPEEANTVYIVGSDRISTEFHNITVDANAALEKPLKLDSEMNDPTDLEEIYYRSDHYCYGEGNPYRLSDDGSASGLSCKHRQRREDQL